MAADTLKTIRHRNKTTTLPIPGPFWDNATPPMQLGILQIECAKFAASMHEQKYGGFQIVVVREGDKPGEHEVVLSVGAPEEKNSGLIVPGKPGLVGMN